jgi:predicted lysophospholipase L1 biosynthesis ABC-type transport system permease subunit
MSEQSESRLVRPANVVLAVLIAAGAVAYVWVVVRQVADGTVFWPAVIGSLLTILVVGLGSWRVQRKRRVLEQTDPEAAERYRRQTRRWSLILAAVGVLLMGLVLVVVHF